MCYVCVPTLTLIVKLMFLKVLLAHLAVYFDDIPLHCLA